MRLAIALLLCLLAAPASAASDEALEPYIEPELRSPGFAFGLDLGVGMFSGTCGPCRALGGLSVDLYAGWQVVPRVAVFADLWSLVHVLPTDGDNTGIATHTLATVAGRLWIVPELWMSAGFGAGALGAASGREEASGFVAGPAAVLAIGGEVDHRPDFGVDLALRIGASLLEDDTGQRFELVTVSATVGWHWY